ncbi:MAG: hypothetical protein ACLP1X_30690 [Polyangiaceae bacterium]
MASDKTSAFRENPASRSFLAVLALMIASPFALLLGGGAGGASRPTMAVPVSPASSTATDSEVQGRPDSCLQRFLRPIYDASGTPPAVGASPAVDVFAGRAHTGTPFGIDVPPQLSQWAFQLEALHNRLVAKPCLGVETIVATVPDPLDSSLAYAFDTTLQALRLGVEQAEATPASPHYFRDREWLPWDDPTASTPSQRAEVAECRKYLPGLVLFRAEDPARPRLLALLLVGETPTSGVHPAAMVNALFLSRVLGYGGRSSSCRTDQGEGCPLCLKVVGPTFSGSAYSLRMALKSWMQSAHDDRPVRIVTGTATGDSVARTLRTLDAVQPSGDDITFSSTTASAETAECAYFDFLVHRLGLGPDEPLDDRAQSPAATWSPRLLHGVAMLHESGTQFGSVSHTPRCGLGAEVDVSFPVHVAALRNAYDAADRKSLEQDPTIARPTSLQVSLADTTRPLETDSDLSAVTTNARDVALSHVLGAISRDGVRHVGIQSTDIVDAIFLARKIRDVAPDVRLAFFEADALLTHESFQHDLYGSFVISPYPFLGTNDFARPGRRPLHALFGEPVEAHSHMPFENSGAEGTFNAMLTTRGVPYDRLLEYAFDDENRAALPMWVSVIGAHGLSAVSVSPSLDCDRTIVGPPMSSTARAGQRVLCQVEPPKEEPDDAHDSSVASAPPLVGSAEKAEAASAVKSARQAAWRAFNQLAAARVDIDPDSTPPRIWHFVFSGLVLGFIIDQVNQRRRRTSLSAAALSLRLSADDERTADLAIVRTKWELYALIRTYVFSFVVTYMSLVYLYVFGAYSSEWQASVLRTWGWAVVVALCTVLWSFVCVAEAFVRFFADYARFCHAVSGRSVLVGLHDLARRVLSRRSPGGVEGAASGSDDACPSSAWNRVSSPIGFAKPDTLWDCALTSFGQVRLLLNLAICTALWFCTWLLWEAQAVARVHEFGSMLRATPSMTLTVVRHLPLFGGVSPAAPFLLCAACIYIWAVGRMNRLLLVHRLSRISPPDGVADLVCTPISAVLNARSNSVFGEAGFSAVERCVVNAISRPSTGPGHLGMLVTIAVVPIVLFHLKPLSTIEDESGTVLLKSALSLVTVLIGATLVQLVQYWAAVNAMLKRLMEHPLGRAFDRVEPFARDSVVDMLSRAPDDSLRLVACAQQFVALVKAGDRFDGTPFGEWLHDVRAAADGAVRLRMAALDARSSARGKEGFRAEAELGVEVLSTAAKVSGLLARAWAGEPPEPRSASRARSRAPGDAEAEVAPAESEPGKSAAKVAHRISESADALAAVSWRFREEELSWLERAQSYVATVVALLVGRYVRQFRVFVYTLTGCALLLLLAIASYPFEPHRLLLTCIWVVMGMVVVAGLWVYVELDQSTVMSHIAGTEPGRLTVNAAFAARVVTWVVLPLLGVAAVQYPQVANVLVQVLEPFARALK